MFENLRKATKGRRGWVRLLICITLHLILLQSACQSVLVLYLFASRHINGVTLPGLIFGLVASALSIAFLILHTILSIQYRRKTGASVPQRPLHTACNYLPRAMIVLWLAAAVAGLLVVSKHPSCIPEQDVDESWQAGIGCNLYRMVVVIAVLTFATSCSLFFCIEACESPFVASLVSMSTHEHNPQSRRKLSASSYDTLPPEISHVYQETDPQPGNRALYWSSNFSSLLEQPQPVHPPSIRHPGPARPRPQLRVNTNPGSIHPKIYGVLEASPSDNSPKVSPVSSPQLVAGNVKSIVSALSEWSLSSHVEKVVRKNEPVPPVPEIPAEIKPVGQHHKRQKSSVSSRFHFLPRSWTKSIPSIPLSEDPEIQEWSSPNFFDKFDYFDPPPQSSPISTFATSVFTANADNSSMSSLSGETIGRASSTTSSSTLKAESAKTDAGSSPPTLPRNPVLVRRSRASYIEIRASPTMSTHAPGDAHHSSRPISPSHIRGRQPRSGNGVRRTYTNRINRPVRPGPPHVQSYMKPFPPVHSPSPSPAYNQQPALARKEHPSSQHRWQQQSPCPLYPVVRQPRQIHPQNYTRRDAPSYAPYRAGNAPPFHTPNLERKFSANTHQHCQSLPHPSSTSSSSSSHHKQQYLSTFSAYHQPRQAPQPPASIPPFSVPHFPRRDDTATIYPATRRPRSNTFGGLPSVSKVNLDSPSSSFSSLIPYYQTGGVGVGTTGSGGSLIHDTARTDALLIRKWSKKAVSATAHSPSLSLNMGIGGGMISLAEEDPRLLEDLNGSRTYRGAERTSLSLSASTCGISALVL